MYSASSPSYERTKTMGGGRRRRVDGCGRGAGLARRLITARRGHVWRRSPPPATRAVSLSLRAAVTPGERAHVPRGLRVTAAAAARPPGAPACCLGPRCRPRTPGTFYCPDGKILETLCVLSCSFSHVHVVGGIVFIRQLQYCIMTRQIRA